jgi:RNA polymerase sigma-70 factor (ECF subfamily)
MGIDFYTTSILPHAGLIIKICRAYTNNQEDFEDYYQEVCLQIWRSKDRFNQQCAWTTWIYKISLNVCLTYLKKNKNSPLQFTSDPLPEQVIEDSSKQVEDSVRGLYNAIHQLSEIDRAIILLYLERQSNQDIADILGLSANNIGVRVLRIKQRLNKLLDYGESSDE